MSGMDIYSKDLRIRALAAVERGMPRREVVEIFSISLTTLKRWIFCTVHPPSGRRPVCHARIQRLR
jgi:hypothetical protein